MKSSILIVGLFGLIGCFAWSLRVADKFVYPEHQGITFVVLLFVSFGTFIVSLISIVRGRT